MIVFSNPGLLDITSLLTFGVSAKDSDNPIGQFGTGAKYAIAQVLAGGGSIKVLSGLDTYEFSTRLTTIREKDFQVVTVSRSSEEPRDCGFTTHLGAHWPVWAIYRELWANCMDEGGTVAASNDAPELHGALTQIIVDWPSLEECHEDTSGFLLGDRSDQLLWSNEFLEVYPAPYGTKSVFFRGIKVLETDSPCQFTYNILGAVTLTEDRTLDDWNARYAVSQELSKIPDYEMAFSILTSEDQWESGLNFSYGNSMSTEFIQAVQESAKLDVYNRSAHGYATMHYPSKFVPEVLPTTEEQQEVLDAAQAEVEALDLACPWGNLCLAALPDGARTKLVGKTLFLLPALLDDEDLVAHLVKVCQDDPVNPRLRVAQLIVQMARELHSLKERSNANAGTPAEGVA